ncbi:MAG: hypothetical protein AAF705_08830 [Bacteroidota bacterium]
MKSSFENEYGGTPTDGLIVSSSFDSDKELVVRSTAGFNGFISTSSNHYPNQLWVMPAGLNNAIELSGWVNAQTPQFGNNALPLIVITRAVDSLNGSGTGYGEMLEFYDEDHIPADGNPISSYSNGVIAAKLYKIKEARGGSWWDARYAARVTADRNGTHVSEDWNKEYGFGKIDVSASIAFNGSIPPDPYE